VALRSSTLPRQLSQETAGHPTRRRDPVAMPFISADGCHRLLLGIPVRMLAVCSLGHIEGMFQRNRCINRALTMIAAARLS
jgi:hypothetical protein